MLYNDLSGDTHLLTDAALALLLALQAAPATRLALGEVLRAEFDADEPDPGADSIADSIDYAAEAEALLLNMKRLYLVDSHAC